MLLTPARRRTVLRAMPAALGGALLLGSVGARACEFNSGRLRVSHPWTRATRAGEDEALLCMRFDQVEAVDRLIGVSTPLAEGVVMAGGGAVDLALRPGDDLTLSPDGLHLRLTGLRHAIPFGRQYPLALQFEQAGLLFARLSVDFNPEQFRS